MSFRKSELSFDDVIIIKLWLKTVKNFQNRDPKKMFHNSRSNNDKGYV